VITGVVKFTRQPISFKFKMSTEATPDIDAQEEVPGYKAPEKKDLKDIVAADDEDESLRRMKEQLLGAGAASGQEVAPFPDDQRHVIVKRLVLVVPDRPEKFIDLMKPLDQIKTEKFVLKEGCKFKIRIEFYVQRDIITGLKYVQKTYMKGIPVDRMSYQMGSYGPKMEAQSSVTGEETAPSGLLARGKYSVQSIFTDDYKTEHLKWDWNIEVKKEWED